MVKALIYITLCVPKQDFANRPRKMPRFDMDIFSLIFSKI